MAGSNKTINTKIVSTVDIKANEALAALRALIDLEKDLTRGLKKAGEEAAKFNTGRAAQLMSEEERTKQLNAHIRNMGEWMKKLGLTSKTIKLFKPDEVRDVNELEKRIQQLAKAYESIKKQQSMSSGTFGLDATKASDAIAKLKQLEKASNAVKAAMTFGKGDADLIARGKAIDANTIALTKHIDKLREQVSIEKAQTQALAMNAAWDKRKDKRLADAHAAAIAEDIKRTEAKNKRLADLQAQAIAEDLKRTKAKERAEIDAEKRRGDRQAKAIAEDMRRDRALEEQQNRRLKAQSDMQYRLVNSASAQSSLARTQIDFSSVGRAAGAYRTQQMIDRTNQLANPVYQAQETARRSRLEQERTLAEVYKQAGVKPEVNGFYRLTTAETGDAKRRMTLEAIVGLQQRLVTLQQAGRLTDEESLRIRTQISQTLAQEAVKRASMNNSEMQTAQAQRNMARVKGQGGASLLAVQGSLMANYAILNGATGAVRSAVTNSVELEAAFRNVQAVTATTSTEMKGLEERIKNVAAQSKFSSSEVAGAALTLGQAGLSAKAVGEAISSVAMLAAASGTNLAQSVDLVTSVIGVFDKQADDTADIANKITAASNGSKVSVDKLALGFQYAGNTAAQAGITFEETTAAMAAMSNAGIRSGSTMGTGLRQFIVETQKPSEEFIKTISRIGLTMGDIDFKSHGLIGVAKRLREAGFIASDAIKSFDVRGAAAFNALIANPEEMQRQYDLLQNTTAGIKANEIQMQSLQAQSTRLTTSMTNLASVGFAPLSQLLTKGASGLADITQETSKYTTTVGILGTALAVVSTGIVVSHVASLAAGAVALLRVNAAAQAASKSLTMAAVAESARSAWTGLWAAVDRARLVYMLNSAAVTANTVATGANTTALGVYAGVTAVASRATAALGAAIKGMSVFTGLGIVIGVATLAYMAFNSESEKAREEMDKHKAAADAATGVYEEKSKVIDSLTNRINELNYKNQEGKNIQEEVTTAARAVNSEFGAQGVIVNENIRSYGELIAKLKETRGEMRELAKAKLAIAQDENNKLVGKQQAVVNQDMTSARVRVTKGIDTALSGNYSDQLIDQQVELLKTVRDQLKRGETPALSALDSVKVIMSRLTEATGGTNIIGQAQRGKLGVGSVGRAENLSKADESLTTLVRSLAELQVSKGEQARLSGVQASTAAEEQYRARSVTINGKSMSIDSGLESFGGNMRAKYDGQGTDRLSDYKIFYEKSQGDLEALKQLQVQVEADLRKDKANKPVIAKVLTEIRGRIEGIKSEVMSMANETQDLAKAENRIAMKTVKPSMGKKDAQAAADAIRQKARLDAEFQTRGIVDKAKREEEIKAILEGGEIAAQNRLDRGDRNGGKGPQDEDLRIKMNRMQESAELRSAEAAKAEAGVTQDLDAMQKLWRTGLQHIENARQHALAVAKEENAKTEKNYKGKDLEIIKQINAGTVAAINMDFNARARIFMESFKGFSSVAGAQLKKMEATLNSKKQELDDMKIASEDKIYHASARLRELEVMQAMGKRIKTTGPTTVMSSGGKDADGNTWGSTSKFSPKGVTTSQSSGVVLSSGGSTPDTVALGGNAFSNVRPGSDAGTQGLRINGTTTSRGVLSDGPKAGNVDTSGETGTLADRIARERIKVLTLEKQEAQNYLDLLGDSSQGLIGTLVEQLAIAEAAYKNTQAEIKKLEDKRNAEGKLNEEDTAKLGGLREEQKVQQNSVGEYRKDLNDKYRERNATRENVGKFDIEISKNTKELPQEVTLDNLKKKMEDVGDAWRETVENMDAVKVFEGGMSSIMGNMTGTLANAFKEMVTGTKSVKDAFKGMATGIVSAMLDVVTQMVAIKAVKGLLNMMGPDTIGAASGGLIQGPGQIERKRKGYATGGMVTGGVSNRDSVPAMLMPGEFVLKRTAVDAVGTDYLHSLNQASNNVVSSGAQKGSEGSNVQPGVVNVWVVSPDQQPSGMGPNDVVAVISDNITRGGSVKKLIKQVVTNQV